MISFFRKKRKKLADDNKLLKYSRYAIGEIVLVVVGILIALQINNLNTERKIDSKRQVYYNQLLQDFDKDKVYIETTTSHLDSNLVNLKTHREIFIKPNLAYLQILGSLRNLNWASQDIFFQSNTIETLKNTGDIQLMPSAIRNKLINYLRRQNEIKNTTKKYNDLYRSQTNNAGMLFGGLDFYDNVASQPKIEKYLSDENLKLKMIIIIESSQYNKKVGESITSESLKRLNSSIDELTKLITAELEK